MATILYYLPNTKEHVQDIYNKNAETICKYTVMIETMVLSYTKVRTVVSVSQDSKMITEPL